MDTLSAEEAASFLHMNVKRVQALARAGKLPGRRVGRRWLFDLRALEAALGAPAPAASGLDLSARNQLSGRVVGLTIEGLMAEVRLAIGDQELTAVITRSSAERLRLRVGEMVYAVIKSTEVMIGKGHARLMNRLVRHLVLAGVPVLTPLAPDPPSTLNVYAAASLTEAFQELGRSLQQAHPGLTVRFNFAGSQQLALQIEQGAPADVFASADQRWMSYVVEKGRWTESRRSSPATGWSRSCRAPIRRASVGCEDLARRGTKIVLAAEAVPVGKYSREALAKLAGAEGYPEDYDHRVLANVVSQEENVKSVVAKVQLGEADAGIVYQSDVTPSVARYVKVFEIPDPYNVIATYPIAVSSRPGTPRPRAISSPW